MADRRRFTIYAWFNVWYLLFVILWGAMVRVTVSGAGCGAHWPKCNGQVIPLDPSLETMIEFGHRLTSGLCLLVIGILVFWSFRLFGKGHLVRKASVGTLLFLIIEAALGAALVLNEWVAMDVSVYRAIMSALHLGNTFILLFFASITAYLSSLSGEAHFDRRLHFRDRQQALFLALLLLLVGMSGAVVALGDTLFPATSLMDGLRQDIDLSSHFTVRLRVLHPLLAIFTAIMVLRFSKMRQKERYYFGRVQTWRELDLLIYAQLAAGVANWLLLAPSWLQLTHLLLADLIWIRFAISGASLFLVPQESS